MYWLFCVCVLSLTFPTFETKLLDELSNVTWLCGNEYCSAPISEAVALRHYQADDPIKINFNINDRIHVLGKPKQDSLNFWLVQTGSQKGIASVHFMKEGRVFINKAVQVEISLDLNSFITPKNEKKMAPKEDIKPSPTKTVLDGTTLVSYGDKESGEEIFADRESSETASESHNPGINTNQIPIAIKPIELSGETKSNVVGSFSEAQMVGDNKNESVSTAGIANDSNQNNGMLSDSYVTLMSTSSESLVNKSQETNDNHTSEIPTGHVKLRSTSDKSSIDSQPNTIEKDFQTTPGLSPMTSNSSEATKAENSTLNDPAAINAPETKMKNTLTMEEVEIENRTVVEKLIVKEEVDLVNSSLNLEVGVKDELLKEVDNQEKKTDKLDIDLKNTPTKEENNVKTPLKEEINFNTSTKEEIIAKTPVKEENNVKTVVKEEINLNTPSNEEINCNTPAKEEIVVKTPVKEEINVTTLVKEEIIMKTPVKEQINLNTPTKEEIIAKTPVKEENKVKTLVKEEIIMKTPVKEEINLNTLPNEEINYNTPAKEEIKLNMPVEEVKSTISPLEPEDNVPYGQVPSHEEESLFKESDGYHQQLPSETVHVLPTVSVSGSNPNSSLDVDVGKVKHVDPTAGHVVATSSSPNFPDPSTEYTSHQVPFPYNINDSIPHDQKNIYSSENNEHISSFEGQEGSIEDTSSLFIKGTQESNPEHLAPVELLTPVPEEPIPDAPNSDVSENGNKEELGSNLSSPPSDNSEQISDAIEGNNWFSGFQSVMDSIKEMLFKSEISDVDVDISSLSNDGMESVPLNVMDQEQEVTDERMHCDTDKYCSYSKDYSQSSTINQSSEDESKGIGMISEMFEGFSATQMSPSMLLCLVITSIVVLLFSLGHYYLENLKQDAILINKVNTLSAELFFAQKELVSIEEQYREANEKYQKLVSETSSNELAIEDIRKELNESKAVRKALEEEIKRLEKEIGSLIEEGDEMHRMLAESFSEEERTKSLLANISDLKGVLTERLQEIVSLTEQLDKEKQEVELLTISLKKSEEKRETVEERLAKALEDADLNTLAVANKFEEKITTLERIIEERSLERTNFEKEICELKGTCELLMTEKELAEKELKKAHGVSAGKALNEWLETKKIRADLLSIQKEAEKLNKELEKAKQNGLLLEEKEEKLLNEIKALNNKYEAAEKEKIEALTKLQVLSNYFKEKEVQLHEELGIKEAQWLEKQSEDHTIYEQMRSLREENLSYRAQNEALKKEILDQEASFKIQIANEEQKAQENWINLRHTERRLKEVQMEAAHLRSRLTSLEANPDTLDEKHKSLEMVNGDTTIGAASPPFMLYPPPDFIPPPPLVSPTRPPPLGRLSSPPLTPPAPLSPFEFFPPPPASPPPPLRVLKPQPREPHRKQKDSQSSNHSSESIEKPIRRGKR